VDLKLECKIVVQQLRKLPEDGELHEDFLAPKIRGAWISRTFTRENVKTRAIPVFSFARRTRERAFANCELCTARIDSRVDYVQELTPDFDTQAGFIQGHLTRRMETRKDLVIYFYSSNDGIRRHTILLYISHKYPLNDTRETRTNKILMRIISLASLLHNA